VAGIEEQLDRAIFFDLFVPPLLEVGPRGSLRNAGGSLLIPVNMLIGAGVNQRRIGLVAVGVIIALSVFSLSHPASRSYISGQISEWKSPTKPEDSTVQPAQPGVSAPAELALPYAYDAPEHQSEFCEDRFSTKYLETLRDHARSYCSDHSSSNLTCFHVHASRDYSDPHDRVDSLCIGRGSVLDVARGRYRLDCKLRPFDETVESAEGLIPFQKLKGYWYETGPQNIFEKFVELDATPERLGAARQNVVSTVPLPRFHLLLKREGESNPWHCLMEIYSTWMSFDVLRMARDPLNGNRPFFDHPVDTHDTQVVILDDRGNGPYWDLWRLFAERTPVRLKQLMADHVAGTPSAGPETNIIVPLAGASNPLWQNDWEVRDCSSAPTLHVFAQRVLDFYRITDQPRNPDHIMVTFIDRKESRRLRSQDALFAALREQIPHIKLDVVDFAAITFEEQLRIVRDTDVLVGVHGAGLTHTMFMREKAGVIVEMQPETLRNPETGSPHNGFRNLANMLRLDYFRIHVPQVSAKTPEEGNAARTESGRKAAEKRDGWHIDDVQVDKDRFLEVMNMAVKSLYAKGVWNFDVN
jgi:protein O-GlcNAc transferase